LFAACVTTILLSWRIYGLSPARVHSSQKPVRIDNRILLQKTGVFFMRTKLVLFTILVLMVAVMPVLAGSGTFSNPAPITIPASGMGPAASNPFPSFITVSGLMGVIQDVNVSVYGFSHTWPSDAQMVLVGPGGRSVTLLAAPLVPNSWGTDAVGVNLTFDDQAAAAIVPPLVSGMFRPTQAAAPVDLGSVGGPALPYGTALSDFNGANPNGSWGLYIYDKFSGDVGQLAGGWSLTVTTAADGEAVVMTCYPPLTADAVVGSLPADTQVYYEPGNVSPGVVLSAGTYHVLGMDESGQYYAIVLGCDRLWVPVSAMVPNTNPDDALWFGYPLPTTVIAY
jgi:hypothetical protein